MNLLTRASALLSTLIGMVIVAAALVLVPVSPAQAATTVYSVPTSNSGLGRIVTAPNGDMWFIESEVGKVGRITPAGVISEFDLPATTTGNVDGSVQGIDVGPDGVVWVTYDYGRSIVSFDPASGASQAYGLGSSPYGGEVRVGADNRVFVTMNFDDSGIATLAPGESGFFWSANAPACDDVLGEAADGSMWCQGGEASGQDTIVRVNGDATGGTTYPLPQDASYPMALAAGPVGSVWFTRNSGGTWFTSANRGSVGFLDQASGATQIWDTGSRSAPQDLVLGPDGNMWFTNVGAEPGIGRISAAGVGVISKVGNYQPTSLTFGPDGAVWFTDATNNSIVRVTTDQVQTTNIDLGTGVTMTSPGAPTTPPTQGLPTGALVKPSGVVKVKKLKIPVKVTCPASSTQGCIGSLRVSVGKKAVTKKASYRLGSGTSKVVKAKVTAVGKKSLRPGKKVKVKVSLTAVGARKPGTTRTFKVIRRK